MKGWLLIEGRRVPIATRTAYQENIGSLLDLYNAPLEPVKATEPPEKPKQPYDELHVKQRKIYEDNGFI